VGREGSYSQKLNGVNVAVASMDLKTQRLPQSGELFQLIKHQDHEVSR
jgi:hypothetical protein